MDLWSNIGFKLYVPQIRVVVKYCRCINNAFVTVVCSVLHLRNTNQMKAKCKYYL